MNKHILTALLINWDTSVQSLESRVLMHFLLMWKDPPASSSGVLGSFRMLGLTLASFKTIPGETEYESYTARSKTFTNFFFALPLAISTEIWGFVLV